MRAKLCEDGKQRIMAKIPVPMGVKEITTFALSNPMFHGDEEAMNHFENLNKRQLFQVAKDAVALRGTSLELAESVMINNWTARQVKRATDHVERLFPEVN